MPKLPGWGSNRKRRNYSFADHAVKIIKKYKAGLRLKPVKKGTGFLFHALKNLFTYHS